MKLVKYYQCNLLKAIEIDVIECNCGYRLRVDVTLLERVKDYKTICPSCNIVIDTVEVYGGDIK